MGTEQQVIIQPLSIRLRYLLFYMGTERIFWSMCRKSSLIYLLNYIGTEQKIAGSQPEACLRTLLFNIGTKPYGHYSICHFMFE